MQDSFFVLVVLQLQHIDYVKIENFDLLHHVPTGSVSRCTRASALRPSQPVGRALSDYKVDKWACLYIHHESKHRMLTTAGAESAA